MWRRAGVIALVACACETHDAPREVGVDASSDAGVDARHDSGRDAWARDVGADAADAAVPEGWVLVTGSFPPSAALAFADATLVASTTFPIEPCPDRAGCRRIVQTWPSGMCTGTPLPCSPFAGGEANGEHDGAAGTVLLSRHMSFDAVELWAVDDGGHARSGFRSAVARAPLMGSGDVHAGSIPLTVYAEDVFQAFLLVVPFETPFSFLDLGEVNHYTPGLDIMQRYQLGDGAVAGEMTSLVVQRIPLDGRPAAVVTGGEGTLGAIVGDTIFFDTLRGDTNDVRVARVGEPAEVLISGPQANSYRIATDGADLVWLAWDVDGTGAPIGDTVWSAPYVEHAGDLVPRRIGSPAGVSVTSPIVVGFGHAAVPDGTGTVRIYRLADAYYADLPPPAGELWFSPAYVGPTEIAVAAHRPFARDYTTQLCFIELDSLDWQPPP